MIIEETAVEFVAAKKIRYSVVGDSFSPKDFRSSHKFKTTPPKNQSSIKYQSQELK